MKKDLLVGIVVLSVVVVGAGLLLKSSGSKPAPVKKAVSVKEVKPAEKIAPVAQKTFSQDMGGLTVRMVNIKNIPISTRGRIFRSTGPKTGVYCASFTANRMQELLPGTYDLELDTVPQMLYRGVSVSKGRESVEDIGCIMGALIIKAKNAAGKEVSYPVNIYNAKTTTVVMAAAAGRPIELMAGTYDVEVGIVPKVTETGVTIESGKEKIIDLGMITGSIAVKVVDQNKVEKKDARYSIKIKKNDNGEQVMSVRAGKNAELRQGVYIVEIGTNPVQMKKDVKVNAGEEIVVEFVVETPVVPQASAKSAVAPKAAAALPAKGK